MKKSIFVNIKQHKGIIALIFLLSVLAFGVYSNALNSSFIFDDELLILKNPFIKSFSSVPLIFKNTLFSFFSGDNYIKMYRPLQAITYCIDYKVWGLNPFGYHLSNLLFHLANSTLFYYLLTLLFGNRFISVFASILFLVHPVHTSVVSYISGRADLLACFFMLAALTAFIKHITQRKNFFFLLSLFFASLSLISRENALFLFLYIWLVIFTLRLKPRHHFYIAAFLLLDSAYLMARLLLFGGEGLAMQFFMGSFILRVLNFLNIILRYVLLLILPLDLHLFRITGAISNFTDIRLFSAFFILLLIIAAFKMFKRDRPLLFGLLWFLIGLIPVLFLLDSYFTRGKAVVMAESWLYMASFGFFTIIALIIEKLKRLGRPLAVILIIFYGSLAFINNIYWKNEINFYGNILRFIPERNKVRINLIRAYFKRGLLDRGLVEINKFSEYYPDSVETFVLKGDYYHLKGDFVNAEKNYEEALNKGSVGFSTLYSLSMFFEKVGRVDKAKELALDCFEAFPYYPLNLIHLGDIYIKENNTEEAMKYYNIALEVEPGNQVIKERIKNAK